MLSPVAALCRHGLLALLVLAGCAAPPAEFVADPALRRDAATLFFAAARPEDLYDLARARFRADCARQPGAACASTPVAEGDGLTIDTGFFPANRPGGGDRLLVLQSGIHGSEAPAGSAAQALFMRDFLAAYRAQGVDVFVIHALNPWGFRHGRRTDGANVNLNRNFSPDDSIYALANPDYDRHRALFEPGGQVGDAGVARASTMAGFLAAVLGDGFSSKRLNIGLDQGQYAAPLGLNYGGAGPTQQVAFLRRVLPPLFRARPYRRILFLDFHTGLGQAGELAVIRGIRPEPTLLEEMSGRLQGQAGIVFSGPDSPGNFPTTGDVIDFVPAMAPDPTKALAVTLEYGTLGGDTLSLLRSAAIMIRENQMHHAGCADPEDCRATRDAFRQLFNPGDGVWRSQVLARAHGVFAGLAAGF